MKYFTFDPILYPNVDEMMQVLINNKRNLMIIIDPHIKVDYEYSVFKDALAKNYFVKNSDLTPFVA